MAKKHSSNNRQQATIEVCGSVLRMVLCRGAGAEIKQVQCAEIVWRQQAQSLLTEVGAQELATAFKRLADEHKLAGCDVVLLLNGAHCVTRVVTGESSDVKREIVELEHRSQLYLSLGPGQKALAGSTRQIDARHQHALLTVANKRTIDVLLAAASSVDWNVRRIEPSLFSLSQTLGLLGLDREEPIMVLSLDEKGVEVGIFFQGMLLLDYRPGGRQAHLDAARIVSQHLPRLQRYCSRYFRFITGKLNRVLVCGTPQSVERVLDDFSQQRKLAAARFELDELGREWNFTTGTPQSPFASALGAALSPVVSAGNRDAGDNGPNLLRNLRQEETVSVRHELRKIAWPALVAAAVVLAMFGLSVRQRSVVSVLKNEMAEYETVRGRARMLRLALAQSETKGKMLAYLDRRLAQPNWSKLWITVGGCLPPNVWIESLHVENGEKMTLAGICLAENGVYEFAHWLKQVPEFSEVALTTTRPVRHDAKPALSFQLECLLVNLGDSSDGKD